MERNTKKELKVVLSQELYDELRFVFRPEVLENILYKPEILGETKWQCCCGSVNEHEVCPICGMDKNTVFSKVNAAFLDRHRKGRIARKKKAMQEKKALMAAQMLNQKKTKSPKNKDNKNKNLGIMLGILLLCIAIIISVVILVTDKGTNNPPIDTGKSTETVERTTAPETTAPSESDDAPETTAPETVPPETTAPIVPVEIPSEPANTHVATVGNGQWPTGASGNLTAGGRVFTDSQFDYLAKDGITVLDKSGNTVSVLTSNKAISITGNGENYIFYIDESYTLHRIDTTDKADKTFDIKAKSACVYGDEVYYIPAEGNGLYACNFYGDMTKIIMKDLGVYALNATADKLYFSTDESLAVISGDGSKVTTFCPDGAKATSIIEITECVFYTGTDGKLKFYNPAISSSFGVEYPRYDVAITHVSAYQNRVYIRTVNPNSGEVLWFFTRWTPGTQLFAYSAFASTGITTSDLYISSSAVYDGNFTRFAVS